MVSNRSNSPVAVFLDTSVLFAAAYSASGSARDLLQLGRAGYVKLFVSQVVFLEVERNLAAKAPRALPTLRTFAPSALIVSDSAPDLIEDVAKVIEIKADPEFQRVYDEEADACKN